MHVLITNDDGPESDGLTALHAALEPHADVSVVVPDRERSACSHIVGLHRPISVAEFRHAEIGDIYVVDGSPADCVRLAMGAILTRPVDWVISGINQGANIGVDVFYSGTVAAAREAAIQGIPAIAFSQFIRPQTQPNWKLASELAELLFDHLTRLGPPRPHYWNVTFPASSTGGEPPAVDVVRLSIDGLPLRYAQEPATDASPGGYRYHGVYLDRSQAEGTDVRTVFSGRVAVTPMTLEVTCPEFLNQTMPQPG